MIFDVLYKVDASNWNKGDGHGPKNHLAIVGEGALCGRKGVESMGGQVEFYNDNWYAGGTPETDRHVLIPTDLFTSDYCFYCYKKALELITTNMQKLPKRLFIESDILHQEDVATWASTVYRILEYMGIPCSEKVFDKAIGYAWHDLPKTWQIISQHDEIFASSSLWGLSGRNVYTGSPVLMDGMMKIAYEKKITGKSLYFLTHEDDILWENIDLTLLRRVFAERNKLFCRDKQTGLFVQVDVPLLIKKMKSK